MSVTRRITNLRLPLSALVLSAMANRARACFGPVCTSYINITVRRYVRSSGACSSDSDFYQSRVLRSSDVLTDPRISARRWSASAPRVPRG